MNYQRAQLYEPLAAEYALGTLHGGARRRMEQLIHREPAVAAAVRAWETRLWPLTRAIAPAEPPAELWRKIERRVLPPLDGSPPRGLWPWLLSGATLVALTAALILLGDFRQPEQVPVPAANYTAMLGPATAVSWWWVQADAGSGELIVTVLSKPEMAPGTDGELWLLRGEGEAPLSLGVLPTKGRMRKALPHADQFARGTLLAVSEEPIGGSPTGAPTGRVLFTAKLRQAAG